MAIAPGCNTPHRGDQAGPTLQATLLAPTGVPRPEDTIRVRFSNRGADPQFAALDVRADPGYWLRPVQQQLHLYRIPPDTALVVEAPYAFTRVSPAATLSIRAGIPEQHHDGSVTIPEPLLVAHLSLGASAEASAFLDRFDTLRAGHLTLYALKGSLAAGRLAALARERDSATVAIAALLGVIPPNGIRLVFYPDSQTKTSDTRHIGNGWAEGGNIVEIYNDSVHVDPFHELTHIVAARLGGPPAWLDEGLATYVSQRLGADALSLLGFPGQPVARAACRLAREHQLVPIPLLFAVEEFGGDSVPADRAYAESAALVEYLLERLGQTRFGALYRRLEAGIDSVPVEQNRRVFEEVTGASVGDVARDFQSWLASRC